MTLAISPHLVDEIQNLAPTNSVFQHFNQIQKILQARRKKIQVYTWTVMALQRQIQRRLCEDRLLAECHATQCARLAHHVNTLEKEINQTTKQIQDHHTILEAACARTQLCLAKCQARQRQHKRYASIPLVGTIYKRKYRRAQQKSQQAENEAAVQRGTMDALKKKRAASVRQRHQDQQEQYHLQTAIRQLKDQIRASEADETQWTDGLTFWRDHMAPLCLLVDQKAVLLQYLLTQKDHQAMSVLEAFQLACVEYERAEAFGDRQWRLEKVDFDCAKCHQRIKQGSPLPDKIKPTDILCSPCYQGSRTRMIIKKKLGLLTPGSSFSSLTPPPSYTR
ncbi:hypothetical protein [Absidia glauca]|uniref:Uncharacterized protein n=1 Tax=Absidia glauca TaxID=4829 RepID=A0A168NZY8_ABSGL|nr:hypothetical protein [Absidia glauca]